MSKRIVKQYSSDFKFRVILEVLKEEETVSQIASKCKIAPANINDWKKKFFTNASAAFNKENAVKEYKEEIKRKHAETEELYKEIGKLTARLNWLKKSSNHLI